MENPKIGDLVECYHLRGTVVGYDGDNLRVKWRNCPLIAGVASHTPSYWKTFKFTHPSQPAPVDTKEYDLLAEIGETI